MYFHHWRTYVSTSFANFLDTKIILAHTAVPCYLAIAHISLQRNNFSGTLVDSISSLDRISKLTKIVSSNWNATRILTLDHPVSYTKQTNKESLSLDHNEFTGTIPAADLSRLSHLESLKLDHNHFTGDLDPLCAVKEGFFPFFRTLRHLTADSGTGEMVHCSCCDPTTS